MGKIKAFKDHYHNALVNSFDCDVKSANPNVIGSKTIKNSIFLISFAWEMITRDTIMNCFSKGLDEKDMSFRYSINCFVNSRKFTKMVHEESLEIGYDEFSSIETSEATSHK
ncbi:hypothetical protein EQH57_0537 [Dictyocoela roeselum]|nr:hypothetical protein EQH57_0537 [Dictyocoela roeselum]